MTVCMAAFLVPVFLAGCERDGFSRERHCIGWGVRKIRGSGTGADCNETEPANDAKAALGSRISSVRSPEEE